MTIFIHFYRAAAKISGDQLALTLSRLFRAQ